MVIGAALAAASAVASAQVSLSTVVDLARRNSNAVKLAESDVSKANAVLSQTKDVIIPTVLFSTGVPVFPQVGFTGNPPSIWTATVQSLIFGVPQKRYIDAARFGLQAASSRLLDAREQVALDASTAYIELDTIERELAAAHQQESFADRLVAIEQERAEAGVDPLSELLHVAADSGRTQAQAATPGVPPKNALSAACGLDRLAGGLDNSGSRQYPRDSTPHRKREAAQHCGGLRGAVDRSLEDAVGKRRS